MKKIKKIIIGTHNDGKFKEICDLLPKNIIKISPKDLNLISPNETGSTFEENSKIKAEYFAKKANLITISDDSGLVIDSLSGAPGIYSSRWAGSTNDFNVAIEKVYNELKKIKFGRNKRKKIVAKFISCLTVYWPNGKFKEICDLLPANITKISPKDLNLSSPNEIGSTFKENSKIKAEYFAKKANLITTSDDSGLVIDSLSGGRGI